MKKIITLAVVVVLALTGCGSMQDAAKARDECHELEGIFESARNDLGAYVWTCHLSDPEQEREEKS